MIALLAGVISPQDLLLWVEQIPEMRKIPEFTTFKEPVKNQSQQKIIKPKTKVKQQNNFFSFGD